MNSIYRSSFHSAVGTVYSSNSQTRDAKSEVQLLAAAARNEEGKRLRSKAEPSNVALPRTLAWAARLPHDIQPRELIQSFGRVANMLAANWDNKEATFEYLHQLVVDTRGCRRGFPPEVANELLVLQRYFAFSLAANR